MSAPDVLTLGAAAGGLALLVRAAPWPDAWKVRKPLGCHACLGAWSAVAVVSTAEWCGFGAAGLPGWAGLAVEWLAVSGVAAVALAVAAPVFGYDPPDFDPPADVDHNDKRSF